MKNQESTRKNTRNLPTCTLVGLVSINFSNQIHSNIFILRTRNVRIERIQKESSGMSPVVTFEQPTSKAYSGNRLTPRDLGEGGGAGAQVRCCAVMSRLPRGSWSHSSHSQSKSCLTRIRIDVIM